MNARVGLLLAGAVLLAAIVVGFRILSGPESGSGQEEPRGTVESPGPVVAAPRPAAAPVRPIEPHRPAANTVDDRRPYDTGMTVDRRMTHTRDGKHIFNEAVEISRLMHGPEVSVEEDVSHLAEVLSFYRMVFKENPVAADNQSVMSALMGNNSRGIVVFPSDHPSLNSQGELMDRWGTPYYFHALSGVQMEVVSVGPDKKLGTRDDIIFTQRDESHFFRGITEEPNPVEGE